MENEHNKNPVDPLQPPLRDQPPAEEAITEENDQPAASWIWKAVVIAIIIMALVYFFVFKNQDVVSSAP